MATTSREKEALASDLLETLGPAEGMDAAAPHRRRGGGRWLMGALAVVVVVGLAAAGLAMVAGMLDSKSGNATLTHRVQKGELLVSVTEDGNLESASNVDIKCEVAGGNTILWIVEDGKHVEEGEELARLDSSKLDDQINQQRITYEKARAAHIQAEKDYNVAKISVQEYLEGVYRQELQDLEAQITVALENLRSAENTLQHTERMFRKGYVSPLQREAQAFAVERAKLELESARTAKDVLERFTKAKTLEDLQGKRDTAAAKKSSEKAAFELEEARLKRLEAQLEKCVVRAPNAGMAVHANDTGGGHRRSSQQPQIEEGAIVREQQTIFRLPDLSQMQVKVAVHESKVDQLRRGMRARIRIQNEEFRGQIESIGNQPEATGWFSANVKEYATIVKIDGESQDLKPGMTAEVEILVAHLKHAITLPVAAIVEQRGQFFCWVKQLDQFERRPLVLGLSNDKFVEVKDGVAVGDEVVMNPRTVVAEARQDDDEPETVDVDKTFGAASQGEEPSPAAGRDEGRRGGAEADNAPKLPARSKPESPGPPGAAAPAAPGDGPPRAGPEGGQGHNLMDLDRDGDGIITLDEAPERMRGFFDRLDRNGDGFVDTAEISAMRSRFGEGGGRPSGGPLPK